MNIIDFSIIGFVSIVVSFTITYIANLKFKRCSICKQQLDERVEHK